MSFSFTEQLNESSQKLVSDYVHSYVTNEDQIVKEITDFAGIKSELYCQNVLSVVDSVKFLSIYADLTSVFLQPDSVKSHIVLYYPPEHDLFIKRNITFPVELLNGHVPKPYEILPGYTTQNEADLKEAFKRLKPLIDSEKFIIRPIRTIMLENAPSPSHVDRIVYYANSDTPNNDWYIKSTQEKDSFLINNGLKKYQSQVLYEVTLPFINNVNIENLSKILEDEDDLLGTFRATLKGLILSNIDQGTSQINSLSNDIIRPQVETINRKFKGIVNRHKLNIGASVTAVTISLIVFTQADGINFQTLFNTSLLGAAAFNWLNSELKYQTGAEKLKDNPYFLLWRFNKAKTSQILKQF